MSDSQTRRFGWLPDLPDHRDLLYSAPLEKLLALPPSADLRAGCPDVYDQGELGSCTANAIAGAVEFDQKKQSLPQIFTPSRLFIYYNERRMEHDIPYDRGARIRDGIKSVAKQGVCPETEWSYDISKFAEKPPHQCYVDAVQYKALAYKSVLQRLSQMKGCLAEGFPFVFGITVYQSFMSQEVEQTGVVPLPQAGEPGAGPNGQPAGHALLAVGYDDASQRFLFRNSWNTTWGMEGYGTIPYSYLLQSDLASDFWTIRLVA